MFSRVLLAGLIALIPALVGAQEVYQTRDKAGPVYSDLPVPGANAVELAPLNTFAAPPVLLPTPGAKPQAAAPMPYERLAITNPENEGAVHTNTGAFDVQWQAVPPLDTQRGDAIIVKLDGSPLSQRFTAEPLSIGAADWQRVFSQSVEHRLQLLIVDADGAVLIESAPVKFYMHHATAR